MYEICTQASFSAAHRLIDYEGPCENLHGHNWLVKAYVRTETLDKAGIGIDFKLLKTRLNDVLSDFDHKDLNAVLAAEGVNPSSENLARIIFNRVRSRLSDSGSRVVKIKVYETPANWAAYFEEP